MKLLTWILKLNIELVKELNMGQPGELNCYSDGLRSGQVEFNPW